MRGAAAFLARSPVLAYFGWRFRCGLNWHKLAVPVRLLVVRANQRRPWSRMISLAAEFQSRFEGFGGGDELAICRLLRCRFGIE
jgi:hypothetical protein